MPSASNIALLVDANGRVVDALPYSFGDIVHNRVTLAGTSVAVSAGSAYRIVADTEVFIQYGTASVAALTNPPSNCMLIPANTPENFVTNTGHTTLSVASRYADGGCFNVVRIG